MATMKYPRLENQNREPILATLEYERRTNEERKKNTELQNLNSERVLSLPPAGWDDFERVDRWKRDELVAINRALGGRSDRSSR